MIRSLIPWTQLTRVNTPALKVARHPLTVMGRTLAIGEVIPPDLFTNRVRLRQLYEQRKAEPVDPPPNTRQQFLERAVQERQRADVQTAFPARQILTEVPSASVFESTVPFDLPPIPVVEEGGAGSVVTENPKLKSLRNRQHQRGGK